MTIVTPTILAKSKEDFVKKINNNDLRNVSNLWQIDILDRTLVDASSWADPMNLTDISLPKLELHLMISDPVSATEDWDDMTSSVKTAIIHAELLDPRSAIIEIKNMQIDCGLAINPETDISALENVIDLIETVLVLGVEPGASGQIFLGNKILNKIKNIKSKYPKLEIAVDGGINKKNAKEVIEAGADRICTASALWNADNPIEIYNQLSAL